MKRVVIDTNALISFVTDRNVAQQEVISEIFNAASALKIGVICHQHVLTEFVYVMDKVYHVEHTTIHQMLKDLTAMPGIEIKHELDMNQLLSVWPSSVPDFGDAILAAICKEEKEATLISFDAQFIKAAKKLGIKVHAV